MSYPGNASLAQDIQVRILETFDQTLKLVEGESVKEAKLGCDFILRLDPMFEPARWLQDRLDNTGGEIVLDDLKEALASAEAATGKAAEPAGEDAPPAVAEDLALDLSDELEELTEKAADPAAPDEPAATQAKAFAGAEDPVPATAEEVMDSPVAALDTESEQRIEELLSEGHAAFDRAEYQSAIDAWSRIFLIDIDHPEANERIEVARKLKAEAERTIEEAYHDAIDRASNGDVGGAKAGLEKVLEMQPDHLLAREQLEKLDGADSVPPMADAPAPAASQAPPLQKIGADITDSSSALQDPDLDALLDSDVLDTPGGELYAPTPGAIPIPKPRQIVKPQGTDRKKLLLYVGGAVLILVLVSTWLLMSNWSRIFPNSAASTEAAADRPDPIDRASKLHAAGKAPTAIAQLRRLPPSHDRYAEAQTLVAQWEAEINAEAEDAGPTEADLVEFAALIDEANGASRTNEYLRVDEALTAAALIQPLDEASENLKLVADAKLEPLRGLIAIFKQGEWERVLRDLWRMREEVPESLDIDRLMIDSYYNLGVRALQRGDSASAATHFKEALDLSPSEPELERVARFAQTYQDRPEDLLYRIFVKYLPFR